MQTVPSALDVVQGAAAVRGMDVGARSIFRIQSGMLPEDREGEGESERCREGCESESESEK